jgi:signal transduction histidine kinase
MHFSLLVFTLFSCVILTLSGLVLFISYKRKQARLKMQTETELARQKELRSKAVIEAEEKERTRLVLDLHDGVGQILSAAKLNLSGLESKLKLQDPEQLTLLANALELVNDSVKEVRAVSHTVMSDTLIRYGLAEAVREFISNVSFSHRLKIDFRIVGLERRLDVTAEIILYRVIQEAVFNTLKHAKANRMGIQLVRHDNELTVMVEDNGIGFNTTDISGGIGLKNMVSRVEFLNGQVNFDSTPGQGTTVVIEVPV